MRKSKNFGEKSDSEILELMQDKVKELYPKSIEQIGDLKIRVDKFKTIVKNFLSSINQECEEENIENKPKIVIVSHHHTIVEYLKLEKEGIQAEIPNCYLIPDPTDYSMVE